MYERFAIFQKPIALDNGKLEIIVLAACALHIFLKNEVQWHVHADRQHWSGGFGK